jgi:RNA polymerase sigma-70 factor (ECF subfamily)
LFLNRKRDTQRFKELAYPHLKFLYNIALRYAGNTYDAEDIVQETFYAAYKNFHQLRDESKCKSWLFAILRRIYLKEIRQSERKDKIEHDERNSYLTFLEEAAERFDIEKAFERQIEGAHLQHILDKIPERYKSPILLYYMDDMSYQEISDHLQIPIGTVMSRLARGKELMKKELLRLSKTDPYMRTVVAFRKTQRKR